ncbi:myosin-binding protein 7 [Canna indica]|uniref:Myosin-binding protein 7 n=1 Tax=Canna indica TaxID=4628 RepID=A0AAQ3KFV9_9LILI|nr:myosin-binding protein 7 [Canna indica]
MDLGTRSLPPVSSSGRLCPCACPFCCRPASPSWRRSMKRRLDPEAIDPGGGARVEVEDEVAALREAVASHQETVQELCAELDEERSASATAASEAMSMILRLQREKAEAQMEARQFKRFAEEKMEHDQQELLALEDLLLKRDEAVQSLTFQVQAYQHLLLSYGIDPETVDAAASSAGGPNGELGTSQFEEISTFGYPPLKCNLPNDIEREGDYVGDTTDVEKTAFGETPHAKEDLQNLEQRVCQLETSPGASGLLEKGVVEELPQPSGHCRSFSAHSYDSIPSVNSQEPFKEEAFPATMDRPMNDGSSTDYMSDRVYTIDAVHGVATVTTAEDWADVLDEKGKRREMDNGMEGRSPDIKNLCMRLQALEADRESMRQAIISMRIEKAQLVLLREIAQRLYKDVSPDRRIVKKKPSTAGFSIIAMFKWILSFFVWRTKGKASRTKYTFRLSNYVGLLLLLDNSPRISNWRCVRSRHG